MSQSSWALVSSWAKCHWSWWHSSSQCLYLILSGKSGYFVGIKNVLEANKYCLSFFSFLFCDEFAPSPTCRRKWQPSPLLLPGESHGQRSLTGYSPWGHKHWMRLKWLTQAHLHAFYRYCFVQLFPQTSNSTSNFLVVCNSIAHIGAQKRFINSLFNYMLTDLWSWNFQ